MTGKLRTAKNYQQHLQTMTTHANLPPSRKFEDLIVWQKSHQFVLAVYRLTENFPQKELYGLTSQFRRAAISIPANIAKGYKKTGHSDKLRFLNIAQGSVEECRYYLILTNDLHYADITSIEPLLEEAGKLLEAYSAAIRRRRFATVCTMLLAFSGLVAPLARLLL